MQPLDGAVILARLGSMTVTGTAGYANGDLVIIRAKNVSGIVTDIRNGFVWVQPDSKSDFKVSLPYTPRELKRV